MARREHQIPGRPLSEQQDRYLRDEVAADLGEVAHSRLEERRLSDNGAIFTQAERGSPKAQLRVTRSGAHVRCRPVCAIDGGFVEAPCKIEDALFTDVVTIQQTPGGAAIFSSCTFEEAITVAATHKAHFIGCTFRNQAAVNNTGVAGNVSIVGCHRSSGVAHVNVTVISETT